MAEIKITFEDPADPPNPGAERHWNDDTSVISTDHGNIQVKDVQVGWKIRRGVSEPWLTVLTVTSPWPEV